MKTIKEITKEQYLITHNLKLILKHTDNMEVMSLLSQIQYEVEKYNMDKITKIMEEECL